MKFHRIAILALLLSMFMPLAAFCQTPDVVQIAPPENVSSPPAQAVKHSEGLHFVVLSPGSGQLATRQYVQNKITGWTSADGVTRFNAEEEGMSANDLAGIREMTPGMATAMAATPIGEKRRWWIAADLLVPAWKGFVPGDYTADIEILGDLDPLPAPDDVALAPEGAITTDSGLKYLVLKRGSSNLSPISTDMVTVHYSGWTTDGKMFDSSVIRDKPADFPVDGLIAGMTEGLQQLQLGDRARIWIPQALAYGDDPRPGAPFGDLVFDVELISITPRQD